MRVHTVSHADALPGELDLSNWNVVVIDVVRASSTMAQALASGCAQVIPVSSVEQALTHRENLEGCLLGGERGGVKIPGFDLGNSPQEYTPRKVRGKTIVFTTTNGTRAIQNCILARQCFVGSLLNLTAMSAHLKDLAEDVLLVPVGREAEPVLDDVLCAGAYVDRLLELGFELSAEARITQMVYQGFEGRLAEALSLSPSGQALKRVGLDADLEHCSKVGILSVIPVLVEGVLVSQRNG